MHPTQDNVAVKTMQVVSTWSRTREDGQLTSHAEHMYLVCYFLKTKKMKNKNINLLKPEPRNQVASRRLSRWGPSKGMMMGGSFECIFNYGFVF